MRKNDLKQTSVSLRDPKEKEWLVNLSNVRDNGFRLRMRGKGWHNFCTSNLIKPNQGRRYLCFQITTSFANSHYSLFRRPN